MAAAAIKVYEYNGAGPAATDKSAAVVRFKMADDANVDLNNPMVKPAAGVNRSFKKSLRLLCVTKGTSTQGSNFKFWWDGAFAAGVTLYGRATPTTSYTQASVAADGTGEGTTWADMATYLTGNKFNLDAATRTFTDATVIPMNYMEMYVALGTTVSAPATVPQETLNFQWDEV